MSTRVATIAVALALAGCQPLVARVIGIEEIGAEQLAARLKTDRPLLLDVRDGDSYREGHIPGALSLRAAQIEGLLTRRAPPRSVTVVTICYHGNQSQQAAARVAALGYRAYSLSGGMQRWRELGLALERGKGQTVDPKLGRPPVVRTSWLAQLAMTVAAFVIKPAYLLLSLLIILALRGRREADLKPIRQGMIFFLVGEGICAFNFLFAGNASVALEALHGAGMVVMGALLFRGLFELLDGRVLRFAAPEQRCVFQRFCGRCWKQEPVSCGFQRLFLLLAPSLALLALIPLCTPLRPINLVLPIFGTEVPWEKTVEILWLERRIYPVLGLLALLVATVQLFRGGTRSIARARAPFFWGVGLLSYALVRYFLGVTYGENPVWADFWEELTELIAVAGVALLLWVFRRQLGLRRAAG